LAIFEKQLFFGNQAIMNPRQILNSARILQPALLSCIVTSVFLSSKAIGAEDQLLIPNTTVAIHTAAQTTPSYKGEIEIDTAINLPPIKTPDQEIEDLAGKAYSRCLSYCLSRSRNGVLKTIRDMAQYATTYKGFESSSEAADIILSEKNKLKSASSLEYIKQRQYDSVHSQITACILQIAMGLGLEEVSRKEHLVAIGGSKLTVLVGEEETENAISLLKAWANQVKSENRVISGKICDVLEMQDKVAQIFDKAIRDDLVAQKITKRLHKYNRHSNFSRVSAKVINTSLSLAALTPTIVSPAAQVTQFLYICATGGPEEAKLLKEVYWGRCLEERKHRLGQEANLALNNYNVAMLTSNPVLLACSESIVKGMVGQEAATTLLQNGSSKLASGQ
jgi:hypothetical protein